MKTFPLKIEKVVVVSTLPDGEYIGKMSGYEVKVSIGGADYILHTSDGIRSFDVTCKVIVSKSNITIEV